MNRGYMRVFQIKYLKTIFFIILIFAGIYFGGLILVYFSKGPLPDKVYRIVIDETWYPLQLYEKDQDMTFFSRELVRAIAAQQNFSIELVQVEDTDLLSGVDNGEYEGVLSSLILNEENASMYLSSDPYYLLGPVLVVTTSSSIKSLKDLSGKTIGLINRSHSIRSLNKYYSAHFVFYDYNDRFQLLEDVINKDIDGMVLNMMAAYEFTNSSLYRNQLKVISTPLNNYGLSLIVKNDPEYKKLIIQFNKGLKDLKKNGAYNKLLIRWDLVNPVNIEKS